VLDEREAAAARGAIDHQPRADAAEESCLAVVRSDHGCHVFVSFR
jgi:hypothetical protein